MNERTELPGDLPNRTCWKLILQKLIWKFKVWDRLAISGSWESFDELPIQCGEGE